jgi:cystine transport system substrate-binding protein
MKLSSLKHLLICGLVGAFIATIAPGAVRSARAADLLDTVKQRGTLVVGLEGTYPPFDSKNPAGELVGYDVDVANAVAARLGVKTQFVTTEWSSIIAGLQAGKFDVIFNQVSITAQRKQAMDFSVPYTYSTAQLIQRKGDTRTFKTLDDLKGHKVGVSLGSNYNDIAKGIVGATVMTYPGAAEELQDLTAGRVDAVLNDRLVLAYLLKTSPLPLKLSAAVGEPAQMGVPFKKGNPKFAQAIDGALAALQKDGTLTKISAKWFGIDVSKPVGP